MMIMKHLGTFDAKKVADWVRNSGMEFADYYAESIERFADAEGRVLWFVVADVIGGAFMNALESDVTLQVEIP
jgi:hypothetical protein